MAATEITRSVRADQGYCSPMRLKGTLTDWNDDRGFGFLEPECGGERAFCVVELRGPF